MKEFIKRIIPTKLIQSYLNYRIRQYNLKIIGDNVLCPICESKYKIFGEFGSIKRTNARCYNCGSLERHRLMYLYLNETFNLFSKNTKPIRLLHFAPEKCFYDKIFNNENINYTPCDLAPELYNFDSKIKIAKVDITRIPYTDESFDLILCNHVLEHVIDDYLAMKELYRVLCKNGNGIFQVPIDFTRNETFEDWSITTPEEREKAFGQRDHVRWYGKDYKERLGKAGFIVNEINYTSKLCSNDIKKFALTESEIIFHCTKL